MSLNHSIAYGVCAVVQISTSANAVPISCKAICNQVDMPEGYVLQILRKLRGAGILRSTRGVDGGYNLARPIEDISVLDVCTAIGAPLQWERQRESRRPETGGSDNDVMLHVGEAIAEEIRTCFSDLKLSELRFGWIGDGTTFEPRPEPNGDI